MNGFVGLSLLKKQKHVPVTSRELKKNLPRGNDDHVVGLSAPIDSNQELRVSEYYSFGILNYMDDRKAELLIDILRDINRTLEQGLEKIDRSLDQIKEEIRDNN